MAVPPERLDAVAQAVNRFPEVNHNYEREHRYNLWFVVTAGEGRSRRFGAIEQAAGYPVLALPLLEEFHIDLGFLKGGGPYRRHAEARPFVRPPHRRGGTSARLGAAGRFALFIRPFALIAGKRIGASERSALAHRPVAENGAIKRFGVVRRPPSGTGLHRQWHAGARHSR